MWHLHSFLLAALTGALLVGGFIGCSRHTPVQKPLTEAQVRQLATTYRDEWLAKNSVDDSATLARSTIVSIEKQLEGWHVTFVTPTGHTLPEGRHDYYLHVYIKPSGELDRIVRGPDLLT
jgi:hypothetical protein